ncbi:hypothetical protein [Cryobacterium sp. TmT3-12]|uniref:hypothetical protein n=1 Tax=Cryobacterium sp. TmT3-12 TaxID=1259266 RepID=UPI00106AF18D|nr:hypothetical protein [Cryobacterium sp. TmT3-12]TFC94734.1 hypothetical protein E3T20_07110 [Cryobacterium sp. TmT3-12]
MRAPVVRATATNPTPTAGQQPAEHEGDAHRNGHEFDRLGEDCGQCGEHGDTGCGDRDPTEGATLTAAVEAHHEDVRGGEGPGEQDHAGLGERREVEREHLGEEARDEGRHEHAVAEPTPAGCGRCGCGCSGAGRSRPVRDRRDGACSDAEQQQHGG